MHTHIHDKETKWKGKYRSMDDTKNWNMKGELLLKNEEISGRKAHTNTGKLNWNILTIIDVFLNQKSNVCKHSKDGAMLVFWRSATRRDSREEGGKEWRENLLHSSILPVLQPPLAALLQNIFTVCSHTVTLFWSRKTSVIIKIFQ